MAIKFECIRCPDSFSQFQELVDHFENHHRLKYNKKQLEDLNALREDELASHFPHLFRDKERE